ncbi:hypothetical protein HB162lentus_01820 [Mammaliicoccus lentus]
MKKLLFLFCLIILLAGCQSKKEKFIQGEWENENGAKVIFDDNKIQYDVDGEKSKKHKFKIRENNEKNIIMVEVTGFPHGRKIINKYEIVEEEKDQMYFLGYRAEDKNGDIIHEAEGGEYLTRANKNSSDSTSATIILIIIAVVGILIYKNKKG